MVTVSSNHVVLIHCRQSSLNYFKQSEGFGLVPQHFVSCRGGGTHVVVFSRKSADDNGALVVVHSAGAVTRGRWTSYSCFECNGQWNSWVEMAQAWAEVSSVTLFASSSTQVVLKKTCERQRCVRCANSWWGLVQVVEKTVQPQDTPQYLQAISIQARGPSVAPALKGNAAPLTQCFSLYGAGLSWRAWSLRSGQTIPAGLWWPTGFKHAISAQTWTKQLTWVLSRLRW